MGQSQLSTALYDWHVSNDARMVDFAGWQMPIQYHSIIEEHQATRTRATLFDVSHMGRLYLSGEDAESFTDGLTTRKIQGMGAGKIRYSLLCKQDGGILDDILVYHLPGDSKQFLWVVNASNRSKILDWIESNREGKNITLDDRTQESCMIAVQGPLAVEVANRHLDLDLSALKYFNCQEAQLDGRSVLVSRTGYTGEDGCEIIADNQHAKAIWELLAAEENVSAAGLGARDTLRLEAAMPLYGHELSETINPAQTDLNFAISMKDREFVGKSAIEGALSDSSLHVRIGLVLEGKRAAREGSLIFQGDRQVGVVTSGTFSPTLQTPIAMGYMEQNQSELGNKVSVDIRGKRIDAQVTQLPFYKR